MNLPNSSIGTQSQIIDPLNKDEPQEFDDAASSTESSTFSEKRRCYSISLGQDNILAPEGIYSELITDYTLSRLPNSPKHLMGLINLRGNLVPLYCLDRELAKRHARQQQYAFLIGDTKRGAAILVHEKPNVFILNDELSAADKHCQNSWLEGCVQQSYRRDSQIWHALDHDKLFMKLANRV